MNAAAAILSTSAPFGPADRVGDRGQPGQLTHQIWAPRRADDSPFQRQRRSAWHSVLVFLRGVMTSISGVKS